MSKVLLAACAVGLVAAGYCGVQWYSHSAEPAVGPAPATEITYVCRETKVLSRGPRVPTPAINPQTGRATLVQALYCPECRKWGPAPPPELRERFMTGPVCPVHRAGLLETGPADSVSPTRKK
jgi:hypothetical protein